MKEAGLRSATEMCVGSIPTPRNQTGVVSLCASTGLLCRLPNRRSSSVRKHWPAMSVT